MGLLVIITLGGIIIFLVLVMLALLNVKMCCQEDNSGDMNSLLQVRLVHSKSEDRLKELLTPALLKAIKTQLKVPKSTIWDLGQNAPS